MATAAAFAPAAPLSSRISGFDRAMIMLGGMMATFMMVLDTTIANVALPHMSTSLGATPETITWVLTSYIVASAVSMPNARGRAATSPAICIADGVLCA